MAVGGVAEDDGHAFAIGVEGELGDERELERALRRGEVRCGLGGEQELEAVLMGELDQTDLVRGGPLVAAGLEQALVRQG